MGVETEIRREDGRRFGVWELMGVCGGRREIVEGEDEDFISLFAYEVS